MDPQCQICLRPHCGGTDVWLLKSFHLVMPSSAGKEACIEGKRYTAPVKRLDTLSPNLWLVLYEKNGPKGTTYSVHGEKGEVGVCTSFTGRHGQLRPMEPGIDPAFFMDLHL